jgi:DNA-binding transcriptional ArsR family regulator
VTGAPRWSSPVSGRSGSTRPDARARVEAANRVFAALAHPARRQILLILHLRGGQLGAGEIAERFGCSWPTTSRHLQVLRGAGLVSVTRHGRERSYALERERLRAVVGDWLGWFAAAAPGRPLGSSRVRAPDDEGN